MSNSSYQKIVGAKNKNTYVSTAQGKLYLDGILIDECYDIQYSYKELKEPIFGYNSKYYDYLLPGNVIIIGSFTINYKHDGYLSAILNKAQQDKTSDINKLISRKVKADVDAQDYKYALIEYKRLVKTLKELEAEKLMIPSHISAIEETINDIKNTDNSNKKNEVDLLEEQYKQAAEEAGETTSNRVIYITNNIEEIEAAALGVFLEEHPEVKVLLTHWLNWQKALREYEAEKQRNKDIELAFQKDLEDLNSKNGRLESEIASVNTKMGNILSQISNLKTRMNNVNSEIVKSLEENGPILDKSKRAEDFESFTLMLEYNGKFHKVLENCTLTGHNHLLGHSGQPVKEYYNFVARSLR